jgi:hypothetical protein
MLPKIRGVGPVTGGVMLIIAGVAFATERFTSIEGVWRWLPLLVVYLAARDLRSPLPGQQPTTIPLLFGVWLLITTIGFLGFDFLNSWPLLLAFVGLGLLIDGLIKGTRPQPQLPHGG